MTVHLLIERYFEDYHGSYDTVIAVYADRESAEKRADEEWEKKRRYDTDYLVESFPVIKGKFKTKG